MRCPHTLHTGKLFAVDISIDGICDAHEALTFGVAEGIKGRSSGGCQRTGEE